MSKSAGQPSDQLPKDLCTINLDRRYARRGVQYFPRGTVEDTVNPKDIWHGGAKYPRISCTGVPKTGDVRITVTPVRYRLLASDMQNMVWGERSSPAECVQHGIGL